MSNVLRSNFRIDRKFFRLRQKINRPKAYHLTWRDESRLSLRRMEGVRNRNTAPEMNKKAVCDEIVRIAEVEVGPL